MAPPRNSHPVAPPPARWVRRFEVATYLHVSPRTVDTWIAKGWITAYRMPGDRPLAFDLNEVDALIRSRKVSA